MTSETFSPSTDLPSGSSSAALPIAPASLPSRALAAIIDYILVTAFFLVFSRFIPDTDYQFAAAVLGGTIYFSLFHSSISKGQTIGKKAFGLRVLRSGREKTTLSWFEALTRYFYYLGFIVIAAEVPPLFYRRFELIADPQFAELHMLFVLSYFIADVALLALSFRNRALHDFLAGTVVIRSGAVPSREQLDAYLSQSPAPGSFKSMQNLLVGLAGAALGAFLWYSGLGYPPELAAVTRYRYRIENRYPVRIVSFAISVPGLSQKTEQPEEILLGALLLVQADEAAQKKLSLDITAELKTLALANFPQVSRLGFQFYPNPAAASPAAEHPEAEKNIFIEVDTAALTAAVKEAPGQ